MSTMSWMALDIGLTILVLCAGMLLFSICLALAIVVVGGAIRAVRGKKSKDDEEDDGYADG